MAKRAAEETNVTEVDGIPSNKTAVFVVKFDPVMVTAVPTGPLAGLKLVIVRGQSKDAFIEKSSIANPSSAPPPLV